MKKIHITSDTHFGHELLVNIGDRERNFEQVIFAELEKIPEDDILVHTGDICIGDDAMWHQFIANLECRKILVRGNHDGKSDNWYLNHGWDFVCDTFTMKSYGKHVIFSHQPILNHGYDLNIHGHMHNNRRYRPEVVCDPKTMFLIAIEEQKYRTYLLETIIKKHLK